MGRFDGSATMDPWRYIDGVPPFLRRRAFALGILALLSLLSCATAGYAQQGRRSQALGSTIPTLEALAHDLLPRGRFLYWCGDRTVMEVDRRYEIYSGGLKASPLSFPIKSTLKCGDDSQKLVFVDQEDGRVSEVDVAGGVVTRTLATYDKELIQEISFSPDLKNVASRQPMTLASSAVNLKRIQLGAAGRFRWSRDSSELFGISAPRGKTNSAIAEIFNAQGQKIASGSLPAGFLFRDGWFATSRALYLFLVPSRDEFGSGVVFRCPIEGWKCVMIARNVLDASVGGDGILAMVRAIGKYSNDGETETDSPRYLVDIRNGALQVVARQTFDSAERTSFGAAVAPSGMKVALTWFGKVAPGCPPEKQENASCYAGIVIDLSGRLK
jgi:hypothetical protein